MSLVGLFAWLLAILGATHAASLTTSAAKPSLSAESQTAASPTPAIGGGGPVHKKK
jgi:hypothetical protein